MATAKPHRAAAHAVSVTTVQNHPDSDWSGIDWAVANLEVKRLQQRIFRASQQQQWKKVRDLQKLLLRSRSNLVLSVRQVTQVAAGKRTPGVDGKVALDAKSRAALVRELQQAPMTGPRPVRRAYIPKAGGKLRPLGIPTIADRVRQHVVKTALEPAWEPHFEARSYGFRPGRNTMDAIVATWERLNRRTNGRWVLDADIRGALEP
jgi:RNA-directed DNA polymerase